MIDKETEVLLYNSELVSGIPNFTVWGVINLNLTVLLQNKFLVTPEAVSCFNQLEIHIIESRMLKTVLLGFASRLDINVIKDNAIFEFNTIMSDIHSTNNFVLAYLPVDRYLMEVGYTFNVLLNTYLDYYIPISKYTPGTHNVQNAGCYEIKHVNIDYAYNQAGIVFKLYKEK